MARPHGSFILDHDKVTDRDRIWLSMRMLRRFTLPQLCAASEVAEGNARTYLQALTRVGILRKVQVNTSSKAGCYSVYALLKDTGPQAPIRRRNGMVYDRNTKTVLGPKEEPEPPRG